LREAQTVFRQAIQMRRIDFAAVTTQIGIAQIVGENDDDIGFIRLYRTATFVTALNDNTISHSNAFQRSGNLPYLFPVSGAFIACNVAGSTLFAVIPQPLLGFEHFADAGQRRFDGERDEDLSLELRT
jgi:hypothetical protein